jgi:hypothetical protein
MTTPTATAAIEATTIRPRARLATPITGERP